MNIENEIKSKGLTAPRVTPDDLKDNIASVFYFTAKDGAIRTMPDDFVYHTYEEALSLLTFCVIVLKNGFTVTGESACASPDNFDPEIGKKIARQNAEQKIWPLMGYELKSKIKKGQ